MIKNFRMSFDFLDVAEAAASIGYCQKTVRSWLRQGRIPYTRFGRRMLISRETWKAFVTEHTNTPGVQTNEISGQGPDACHDPGNRQLDWAMPPNR